jgi:hypothetical protein
MGNNVCAAHHEPLETPPATSERLVLYICERALWLCGHRKGEGWKEHDIFLSLCCLFPQLMRSAENVPRVFWCSAYVRQLTILRFRARGDLFCARVSLFQSADAVLFL